MVVATIYSTASDGEVQSRNTTYSTARAGSTLSVFSASTVATVGQELDAGTYFCYESFLSFDTSAIGASATVSAVDLDIYLTSDFSTTDFTINARTFDWSSGGLTTGDYVAGASLSANTLLATCATSGIGATGSYKTFASQAAFLTAPNLKTGTVYIVLASSRLEGNNTPTGTEYIFFSTADASGTTQDPKLTVTYTLAGKAFLFPQRTTNRIWRV